MAEQREVLERVRACMALEAYRRKAITRAKLKELAEMVAASTDELERLLAEIELDDSGEGDVLLPDD